MPLSDHLSGLAAFAAILGAIGIATGVLVQRRLAYLSVVPKTIAAAVIATCAVIVVHLIPLALGLLSVWTVLALAIALPVAVGKVGHRTRPPDPNRSADSAPGVSRVCAVMACGGLALSVTAFLLANFDVATRGIDALSFYLPSVARWIQSGTVWNADAFTPLLATNSYPQSGNVLILAVMLPWENDAFVRWYGVPFVALAGLATFAIGEELGVARASAATLAAAAIAMPVVTGPALIDSLPDAILLAGFASGVLFLLRDLREPRRVELVLAGAAFGLACGAKWYGPTSVAPAIALWGFMAWRRGRGLGGVARDGAALSAVTTIVGGFWLIRNWVVFGNPLFPAKVEALGVTIFDAPPDPLAILNSAVADYLFDATVWRQALLPAYDRSVGLAGILLLTGIVTSLVLIVRRRAWKSTAGLPEAQVALLSLTAIVIVVAYVFAPGSAQGLDGEPYVVSGNVRYAAPALLLGAPLLGWLVSARARLRGVVEIAAIAAVLYGIVRGPDVRPAALVTAALALAVAILVARYRRSFPTSRRALAGFAALGLVALSAGSHLVQSRFNDRRYASVDEAVEWVGDRLANGHQIGVAGPFSPGGLSPTFPMFGPRLGNEVQAVAVERDGLLVPHESAARFSEHVHREALDFVLIGHDPPQPPESFEERLSVALELPPVERWSREAGFEEVVSSRNYTLFRVPPRGG